eukprot:TRINITY_DN5461_c0_g1_i2.p3 TRINITY_DN5461_c0_g1~~TRINITY_DN5461_c0_g1_i2.p3  ORF type:complete len:134 (+),score=16.40 TRINITY_DN5461_c0_g1_i2:104-505(+)
MCIRDRRRVHGYQRRVQGLNKIQNQREQELNLGQNLDQITLSNNSNESSDCESLFEHILKFLVQKSVDNSTTLIKPKLSDFTEYKPTMQSEIRPTSSPILQFTQRVRKNSFKPYSEEQDSNSNFWLFKLDELE